MEKQLIDAEKRLDRRNKYAFGLGTIGRDMFYTVMSMFLMVYLTEALDLSDEMMWWMTGVFTVLRVFDAVNDPVMGMIVDNTTGKWGKFKPWLGIGGLISGALMVLIFSDLGLTGAGYIIVFAVAYLGWDIAYGLNDIAYWSMMPTLSLDQKERERIGAFARICANIGLFVVVVAIVPVTNMLGDAVGSAAKGWQIFVIAVTLIMFATLAITMRGVKERKGVFKAEEKTSLKDMFRALFKNDQLLWVTLSMALFLIGYLITTSFGVHYFKYIYGDEGMYSIFAAVLGVSQIAALAVFPLFSKRFSRTKLYTGAVVVVIAGYLLFFLSPLNMLPIGIAGVLIFAGEAFIQLLMLVFLADTIEYGQWKLGKRNDSVTFSIQPFINKIAGAAGNGVLGATLILSGINEAAGPSDVTPDGVGMVKFSMFVIPMVLIVIGYIIYRWKYRLNEQTYKKIVDELNQRGDISV